MSFVRESPNSNEWILRIIKSNHEGHPRVHVVKAQISHEEKEAIAEQIMTQGVPIHSIVVQLWAKGNTGLTTSDISNYVHSVKKSDSGFRGLLDYLGSLPDHVYVVKYEKRRAVDRKVVRTLYHTYVNGRLFEIPFNSDISVLDIAEANEEDGNTFIQSVLAQNDEASKECILVPMAVVWAKLSSIRKNLRFPEILSVDATCNTNMQRRPLIYVNGIDSSNKTFCLLSALVVDETLSTFSFVMDYSMLKLYGASFCRQVSLFVSDGDNQICQTIDRLINSYRFSDSCERAFFEPPPKKGRVDRRESRKVLALGPPTNSGVQDPECKRPRGRPRGT